MPPKRPIKPALQQPQQQQQQQQQQLQQVDPQTQQGAITTHGEAGAMPVGYGHAQNVAGINVGFHQPHPHHRQLHPGVIGADSGLVMDTANTGTTGGVMPAQSKGTEQRIDQASSNAEGQNAAGSTSAAPPALSRKRSRVNKNAVPNTVPAPSTTGGNGGDEQAGAEGVTSPPATKRTRTNTPWTPQEEQRLKAMRDAGKSWSEIAKTFPNRTEGSVKKHWYKDMHYAEFGEDESAALLAAIKDYESNKWKVVGQKVGKPAKACEQYAKEHFGGKT